jgi:high-affinity nickel-transport protein
MTGGRSELVRLFGPLILANAAIWALALMLFGTNPVLLGAASLAYLLGIRHAVDPDHIAAIDITTRKLMHHGPAARRRPALTGLYFSLGHSTVVWIASIGIALAAATAAPGVERLRELGGLLGTAVSVFFLFAIAITNLVVLKSLFVAIRRQRTSGSLAEAAQFEARFSPGGPLARLARPLFRLVTRSRHMFLIGVLFGLGFDTATEIAVLGISAAAASHGMPIWTILVFPALFTSGMSLVDTLDSAFMTRAYGWALVEPQRKLFYNFTITFASVLIAVGVGVAQLAALLPLGRPLRFLPEFASSSYAGLCFVALFALLWLFAWRLGRNAQAASQAA